MEINVTKLESIIEDCSVISTKIKNNNDDIIYNFTDLSKNWNDPKNKKMIAKFNIEKRSYLELENDIKNQLSIYVYLKNKYSKLGNKIKFNLDKKNSISNRLDIIIDQLKTIIWQYDNLGDISFCPISGIIYEQRSELSGILDSMERIRSSVNNKMEYISAVEKAVSEKTNNIDVEYISSNNYESED